MAKKHTQLKVSEVKAMAKTLSAKEFMRRNFNSPYLELQDIDNILDYNEGYCNIWYHTPDRVVSITFRDGSLLSTETFYNI